MSFSSSSTPNACSPTSLQLCRLHLERSNPCPRTFSPVKCLQTSWNIIPSLQLVSFIFLCFGIWTDLICSSAGLWLLLKLFIQACSASAMISSLISGRLPSCYSWCSGLLTFLAVMLICLPYLAARWNLAVLLLSILRVHLWWNSSWHLASASSSLSACPSVPRQVWACSTWLVSALPCIAWVDSLTVCHCHRHHLHPY